MSVIRKDGVYEEFPSNSKVSNWETLKNPCFMGCPVLWRQPKYTRKHTMKVFTAVVERCPDTGLYVGFVPGFPGAHTQGETLDELNTNLKEVIEMLLEDGIPKLEAEFVGTQTVMVA